MDEPLLKYKLSNHFITHSTFKEYLLDQMSNNAQDDDFIFIKRMFDDSKLTTVFAISEMAECRITSLPFYTNYLFFNFKIQFIKVLVKRFNKKQSLEDKIVIYNCIRLLISHLELSELLKVLDRGVLAILIGEYVRNKGLPIEDLGLANFHYKFLGYFTMEEIETMKAAELKMYIEKDIDVMKIFTMCTANHFNLEEILNEDAYLRFYLENCITNMNLLKKLKSSYNPYILFLLFDKLRDDESFCKARINELSPTEKTSLFILFARDDEWLKKYATEELPSFNFQPKNEHQILRLINHIGKKIFHFSAVQQLHKFMPKDKQNDLKEIDNYLFEKSMPKILAKCLEEGMRVDIFNWMSSKEIYFSLVVKNYPWLNDFHKSDKKKRSQKANNILLSENKYIFLQYLEQRKILVDFRKIGEIDCDFSVEWLKLFIEENHERIKKIVGDEYNVTIITRDRKKYETTFFSKNHIFYPMKNLKTYTALTNFIQKNPCFAIVGQVVMCKVCTTSFTYSTQSGVFPLKQHLITKVHKRNEKSSYIQKSLFNLSSEDLDVGNEFDCSLLKALCAAQIPLGKLENPVFKEFLERYTSMTIKSESWYRKCLLNKIYTNEINKKYKDLADKNIYIMFDETTDSNGRYILHVMAGECCKEERKRAILFKSIELEKTNAININQVIINFLIKLHHGNINYDRIKMIVSDQAPYAIKVGKLLKEIIPGLKHVTCLCHLLHRLCEEIRGRCNKLNHVVSEIKRLLVKNRHNQQLYGAETGLTLPKFPIITRWGTWIEFVCYIADNLNEIKSFAKAISNTENCLYDFYSLFNDNIFIQELKLVQKNKFIVDTITSLESETLSTEDQLTLFKSVTNRIEDEFLKDKLDKLCKKNPDLSFFINYCSI